jgi:hypothetical protein
MRLVATLPFLDDFVPPTWRVAADSLARVLEHRIERREDAT